MKREKERKGGKKRKREREKKRKKRENRKESVHGAEKYRQIAHMHTYVRAHDVAFNNR